MMTGNGTQDDSAPASGFRRPRRQRPGLRHAACAAAFSLIAGASASAASLTTVNFVAATTSAVALELGADGLSFTRSDSRRIRAFAKRADVVQTHAADAFAAWGKAERTRIVAAAETRSLDGLGLIQRLGGGGPYYLSIVLSPRILRADTVEYATLARLTALNDERFDELYARSQTEALAHLVFLYTDFIKNGDDVTLRALSVRELPQVKRLLAEARGL